MNRFIAFFLASLALSGCCFSCGDSKSSARRTVPLGPNRLEVVAESFSYSTPGRNRGDWGGRVHGFTIRARVDERPDFEVGKVYTQQGQDEQALKLALDGLRWQLSPNGQHLSLESNLGLPTRFYLLPSGGPGFTTRHALVLDESKPATDIVKEALAARTECGNSQDNNTNRNLFRAVSFSADEALHHELLQTCGPQDPNSAISRDIDAVLVSALDGCHAEAQVHGHLAFCSASTLELCLAARSSRCHEPAVAYILKKCSRYMCFEAMMLEEYASPEERKRLRRSCRSCF